MDCSGIGKRVARDRHDRTRTVLSGLADAGAGFIVREHGRHLQLVEQGAWRACGRVETRLIREQTVEVHGQAMPLSASLTSCRGIAS